MESFEICFMIPNIVCFGDYSMCGESNGNPLQYSCLETPIDGGAWWGAVHGVAKSQTRLSDCTFTFSLTSKYTQQKVVLSRVV